MIRTRLAQRLALFAVGRLEVDVQLGQYLWGNEALDPVCDLVVLETGAGLPQRAMLKPQLKVIAKQAEELPEDFTSRLSRNLAKQQIRVETALYCLNGDSGWATMLNRLAVARAIAAVLLKPGSRLQVVLPAGLHQGISLEMMALADMIRREFGELDVAFQLTMHDAAAAAPATEGEPSSSRRPNATTYSESSPSAVSSTKPEGPLGDEPELEAEWAA